MSPYAYYDFAPVKTGKIFLVYNGCDAGKNTLHRPMWVSARACAKWANTNIGGETACYENSRRFFAGDYFFGVSIFSSTLLIAAPAPMRSVNN